MVIAAALMSSPEVDPDLEPPASGPLESDWARLASGEWLKGELDGLSKKVVSFESAQMGHAEWFIDDVTHLYLCRTAVFVFVDKTRLVGRGQMTPDEVVVTFPGGVGRRPRDRLLQIISGEDDEWSRWQIRAGVGADISDGNAQQLAIHSDIVFVRKGDITRLEIQYVGSYGRAAIGIPDPQTGAIVGTRDETTVNNHRGNYEFEIYFSPQLYLNVVDGYFSFDELQGIALRAQPGTTIGWRPVDDARVTLDFSLGGGFQYTTFIGGSQDEIYTGGVLSTIDVEWDPPGPVGLAASTRLFGDLGLSRDANQSTIYNRFDLTTDITGIFSLVFTFLHQFVASPVGINPITGLTAFSNDFQYVVGARLSVH